MQELQLYEDTKEVKELGEFAFLGGLEFYEKSLESLKNMADYEDWGLKNEILRFYISSTYKKCLQQNKILFSERNTHCCFNTGLLTKNGEDIITWFEKNNKDDAQEWFFKGFISESDRYFINLFPRTPEIATYFNDLDDILFDTELELVFNADHILDDNWDRFPEGVQILGKDTVQLIICGMAMSLKKRIKRNYKLAVPQYYKGKLMFLLPICINHNYLALAVERIGNKYRANTILTLEMAYRHARLLMKQEYDWLIRKNESN